MSSNPEYWMAPHDEDEGLSRRDINGQLVRLDDPTQKDFDEQGTIQVDGRSVQMRMAQPLTDSQGHIIRDLDGNMKLRRTTILDAVTKLNIDRAAGDRATGEPEVYIPTLCHQPHMTPVAVCRLCVVQVAGLRREVPACSYQVKDGTAVSTTSDSLRRTVHILTELLMDGRLQPSAAQEPRNGMASFNELQQIADRCGLSRSRFAMDILNAGTRPLPAVEPPRGPRLLDSSSPVFRIDHSACILCQRCSRACNEVKNNQVIGRTGKGWTAGIGFDLNDEMFESSCVQCGECMVSCPTSAITFNPLQEVRTPVGRNAEVVPFAELQQDELFQGVPPKFLLWQAGLVVRRRLKAGDFLCRQGEPGHSAFIIKRGSFQILEHRTSAAGETAQSMVRTVADLILGEMACLSGNPRSADMRAAEDSEVWEVRRNVLDRMLRSPKQRPKFEKIYAERSLTTALRTSGLFAQLPPDEYERCAEFLRPRLKYVRVDPGQPFLQQGEAADCMYLVRLGHVRVGISRGGVEVASVYRGPGTVMGEMGLLAISPEYAGRSVEEVCRDWRKRLDDGNPASLAPGRRTATCIALDHVELARVERDVFLDMLRQFPSLLTILVTMAIARSGERQTSYMQEFIAQGLYQGQSLLVLDLNKCTRCDECTKACVEKHGESSHGHTLTRLLRQGQRFGDLLVATACRSCKDAYCMIGCPVDAIHRGKHLQIVIEDHCIGCGLCARNCPYDNIFMEPKTLAGKAGREEPVPRLKAATCDLCDAEGRQDIPTPSCVRACPHDAAHRMTGEQLFKEVAGQPPRL